MIIGNATVCAAVDHGDKGQSKIVWIMKGEEGETR